MRKRSIFLALGTVLALVVLTAGLAFASGRWDGHDAAEPAATHQVSTTVTAQQPSGSVRSTGPQTGRDWCNPTRMAAGYTHCVARTSNHRSSSVPSVQATTRPTATTTAPSSRQPRYRHTYQRWYGSGSRWSHHDGCCRHDWR
ncbi:MAG TPA: hypothetical protein VE776_05625 [Actinomycetota bacterium]|jgi:hypothetical protein|nr:hypothetical protein [Actinomycetota bacterium]